MKKRILSVLLAALLVSSALVSCSNTEDDKKNDDTTAGGNDTTTVADATTEPEEEVDPRFVDELPEKMDFDGYTYTVLTNLKGETDVAWKIVDIEAECETGERINDAVYARNMELAERFNIKVKMDAQDNNNDTTTRASNLIMGGDEAFTVAELISQAQGTMAVQGLLVNMANLDYLNFDKGWWDTDAVYGMSISKDRVYFAGGSATLNTYRSTWGVLFNKDLVEDAQIPDLYQTVRDGDWTLDLLKEYAKQISRDLDGNGTLDYGTDIYGLAYQYECVLPLFQGAGAKVVEMKDNGSFDVVMDSSRATEVMEKVYNFMNVDSEYLSLTDTRTATTSAGIWGESRNYFMQGLFGFFMGHLSTPVLITDCESDFGILPMPKLDDAQEDYASSYQYNNYFCLSIPKNAEDLDRTALLTEAYTMLSYDTVREAWYDYTLTLRAARDSESGEMLDIIFAKRGCDIAFVFNSQTSIQTTLQNAMKENSFTWASTVASNKETFRTKMQDVIDKLNALED